MKDVSPRACPAVVKKFRDAGYKIATREDLYLWILKRNGGNPVDAVFSSQDCYCGECEFEPGLPLENHNGQEEEGTVR
jgi:hypothetical protein